MKVMYKTKKMKRKKKKTNLKHKMMMITEEKNKVAGQNPKLMIVKILSKIKHKKI